MADLRPQYSDRYGAHSGRPVPGDEQGSGVAGRRRSFAPPARFGAAAVEEFRSRAVHPDRRKHGLCHRGAHERSGGGEIRARRYRDHGRHPNGQRRGERFPGAADAFHLDVGFQERPRAADGDRSGEARYAHTRILRPCDGALLCRSAVSGDPHEPARSDAQRGDLRYAGSGRGRAYAYRSAACGAVVGCDPDTGFPYEGRLYAGGLRCVRSAAHGGEQPASDAAGAGGRSVGQSGDHGFRPQSATSVEYLLFADDAAPADAGAQHHRERQRPLLRQGLRHGARDRRGRQGERAHGYRGDDGRRFGLLPAAFEQVERRARRLHHLRDAAAEGRYAEHPRTQEADVRTQAQAPGHRGQFDGYRHDAQRAAQRRLPAGDRSHGGRHHQGARRGNAQSAYQSPFERLRDVRRLYDHRRKLSLHAPEHHQQAFHHRERVDDPVDGRAARRAAQYQCRLQTQNLAATAHRYERLVGRRRHESQPCGTRRVHHQSERPADPSDRHLRREGAYGRRRIPDDHRQHAQHAVGHRRTVHVPARYQQFPFRHVGRRKQPRRCGFGRDRFRTVVEPVVELAFDRRLQHRLPLSSQVGAVGRRGRFRVLEKLDKQPPVRRGGGQLHARQLAGSQ